jgi:hypothetical protein
MNKLDKLKSVLSLKFYRDLPEDNDIDLFNAGFDAAIALELPVKFANWKSGLPPCPFGDKGDTRYLGHISNEEFYQYWLENVLKIE